MNSLKHLIILLALMTYGAACLAAEGDAKPPKIFSSDAVIAATIDGPWRKIMRYKEDATEWPGTFTYNSANGEAVTIPITITTRGLTRKRVCDFPPLRFKFDKEASKGTEFRGAGNLKLVTHCFSSSRYAQYYIKEYLSYKMYNQVTDKSFRVQGIDAKYVDGDPNEKGINRFAFLIEDPDDVAKRQDMQKLAIPEIPENRLDPAETTRFMLFQYLISNLDWSVLSGPKSGCCHNARLISNSDSAPTVFAIPYDLDSSGLVDTHYAAPPQNLKVRSVRQRLYRGFCIHNDQLPAIMGEYRGLHDSFTGLFENEPRLDSRSRNGAIKFINSFYSTLADQGDIQKQLIDKCRG